MAGERRIPTAVDFRGAITAIYAELDRRPVERICRLRTGCCQFRLTGRIPHLTRGETLFAAIGVRASGRTTLPIHPTGTCPPPGADGHCAICAHRPFGCRTHFCHDAGGTVPRALARDLIQPLDDLDARLADKGH